mmetsp:Transcript_29629/g.62827  ORF Transcript_29629/g.62827 Transcript_29629/m.62827 type:complete len:398 (-) Transcript_29629:76-1269(-)|eukprot:CAMPEP_0172311236 /NCGR_PEP_ID=MMETSP1058-20130122/14288_1 /TAXON_ID=83371 /ORGANISM="Detonula confervacea, Strain CCMP 353" /LENGTH=397 /DNA_ID=CAMNT_0013024357 /DNA_START=115 /DNA_END=1308 /DNA_ORIENTATION=-
MANNTQSPIFEGLSLESPSILTISITSDPTASLGVQLSNHDNGLTNEMFLPGYASVGGILDGKTLATKSGVKVGDYIVAVSGEGYRRFPPDFQDEDLEDVTGGVDLINLSANESGNGTDETEEEKQQKKELKARVVTGKGSGDVYGKLLASIRDAKTNPSPTNPLLILERYMWDSRVHSWSRFLSARNGNVPAAMTMIQAHERWRNEFFPIDLTEPSLQKLLKGHAVSEIDIESEEELKAPVVYIDFAKLQLMGEESVDSLSKNVVRAFVVYTETLLSKSPDPRSPKTSQFVDLTGVSIKQGLQPGLLKMLYATFEPNYPETLEKMVLYPVPRIMVRAVNAMLGFVNEHTRKKFIITDDLQLVCKELGWNLKEIETCGSVNGYMKKHLKHGLSFVFD